MLIGFLLGGWVWAPLGFLVGAALVRASEAGRRADALCAHCGSDVAVCGERLCVPAIPPETPVPLERAEWARWN